MDLSARIDRLEAIEAIRQLAYGYALAIDCRDLEALANLYVENVRVGMNEGRGALRAVFDAALRQFTTSVHHVTNHLIEFIDADNAIGLVNCRIEHEVGDDWVTATLLYCDRYVQNDGVWLFRGRVQARLYATAADDPPVGLNKLRWPGCVAEDPGYYQLFESWARFWRGEDPADVDQVGASALVSRFRGTTSLPPSPKYRFSER